MRFCTIFGLKFVSVLFLMIFPSLPIIYIKKRLESEYIWKYICHSILYGTIVFCIEYLASGPDHITFASL